MIKFISAALLFFFTSSAVMSQTTATENLQTTTKEPAGANTLQVWAWPLKSDNLRFLLQIYNPSGKRVSISINHVSGLTMEGERFYGKEFAKIYNLSELEDGVYSFKVSNGKQSVIKKVNIRTETTMHRITEVN